MKYLVIPYSDNAGGWTSLAFYNHADQAARVLVKCRDGNGKLVDYRLVDVKALGQRAYSPDVKGPYSIYCALPDAVMVAASRSYRGAYWQLDLFPVADDPAPWEDDEAVGIDGGPGYRYNGQTSCRYTKRRHLATIEAACVAVLASFPYAKDTVVNLGDACPAVGVCPGHPSQHGSLTAVDIDYLTTETNCTQYDRQFKVKKTSLWDGDKLNNLLDVPRNIALWRALGNVKVTIDDRIAERIRPACDQGWFAAHIHAGTQRSFNHHTHAHVLFLEDKT